MLDGLTCVSGTLNSDSGIYTILCTSNGKVYVGSTNNFLRRYREHERKLLSETHANAHLQAAYRKYGADAFTFEIVERCEPAKLLDREEAWFLLCGVGTKQSFNICLEPTSRLGGTLSAAARKSISDANRGREKTEEEKRKWREANLGRKRSPEFIKANKVRNRSDSLLTVEIANDIRRLAETPTYNCYGGRKKLREKFSITQGVFDHLLAGRTWTD